MMPILYEATETTFASNGVGVLSDAISCRVTEERNGAYELVMQYPISGIHYAEIELRSIVLAKPNPTTQSQPFRVYRITRPINGIVEVYAEHISYDLSGIPIRPFTSSTIQEAFQKLKTFSAVQNPFTFYTDKTTIANMSVPAPCSLRSQLGGKSGSILDVYGGGEYEFDRYAVNLYQHRGMNRGVSIRYGKNLTDLKQEQNCANVYTGVYPYWVDSQTGTIVQLSTPIVPVEGTFNFDRVLTLDLSSEYQDAPTQEQLYNKTLAYIEQNQIGVPKVNLDVSFVQLEQSDEYKGMALLDRVSLCDEVNIYFDKLGVNATAKAIKIVYNSLLDRIESVELGDSRTKFTDTVLKQEQAVENVLDRNDVASMIDQLTAQILGANGGAVRLLDDNGDGVPDTLYIADNADPAQSVKVWRFNYLGWGASSNGYNGPFTLGATLENGIIANFITAGILNANLIKAGIIQDKTGKNYWNMDTGAFQISSSATVEGSGGTGNPDKTITQIANTARSEAEATAASALASAVQTLNGEIDDLQGQIDGSITTWFYGYDPAVNLYPSIDWTTTEIKNQHLGDLFYNTTTGSCWRWMLENNVYSWQRITDTEVSKAIADAAKAQTTADSKRRVFLSTPTVPYDSGDLWFDSNSEDLLTCVYTKSSGSFNIDDWEKLTKYTDDSLAEQQAGMIAVNQTAIKNLQDRIESTVSKTTYDADLAKKADMTYVQSTVQSAQTQTAEAIENRFSESKTYTDNALGEYRQLKEDVYAWQRFSADGMEIGKSNSPFKTRLSNSRLSFLENDTEVAYIGESALNITNARVRQILSVGTETDGWFDWVMGVDGLTMKWKG